MKNILLSTTAIISLFAGVALAETTGPTASVEGIVDFQAGFRNQKKAFRENLSRNQSNVVFNNTASIAAKIEGKADVGFNYGAVVGLKTNAERNRRASTNNLDRTYVFVESDAGRVELGSNYSAAKAMKFDAGTFARGSGGINGEWYKYYNLGNSSYGVGDFIGSADNFSDYLNKWSSEDSRKVTYYSPRMSGFQFGISYIPDAVNKGNTDSSYHDRYGTFQFASDSLRVKDIFSGGLTFVQQMEQMTLSLSATGESGKVNKALVPAAGDSKHIQSYAFGANVEYAGMVFGGSYGVMSKKNFADNVFHDIINTSGIKKDAKYWTAGVGMVQGPIGASVNYIQTDVKGILANVPNHASLRAMMLDVDYQLAAGVKPYGSVILVEPKYKSTGSNVAKNKGAVFMVGTQFTF